MFPLLWKYWLIYCWSPFWGQGWAQLWRQQHYMWKCMRIWMITHIHDENYYSWLYTPDENVDDDTSDENVNKNSHDDNTSNDNVDDFTDGDKGDDNRQQQRQWRCVKGASNLLGGRTSPHALSLQPSEVWRRRRGRWMRRWSMRRWCMRKGKMGRGRWGGDRRKVIALTGH